MQPPTSFSIDLRPDGSASIVVDGEDVTARVLRGALVFGQGQTPALQLELTGVGSAAGAGDVETNLLGRLNKVYKTPPAAVSGRTYQGPYGYVIE